MDWLQYLRQAVDIGASDIFFVAGGAVCVRLDGQIHALSDTKLLPDDTEQSINEIYAAAKRSPKKYLETGDDDFSFSVQGLARFRINTYRQRSSTAAVIRIVSYDIPDFNTLRIPESVMELASVTSGLVLFTGTAGSGKSTTQACIIDRINNTRSCHIVTLEDPIEYLHRHRKSIVSQREIAVDAEDYPSALRACLRQSPDVIQLGEMRDAQTMFTAMTAAETGHTVLATLHTKGAVNAIDRVIDAFPAAQQGQIRVQLSAILRTVVAQQLLPGIDGGQVPAFELMHMNNAIRTLIRENKNHQIDSVISSSSSEGMCSMDQSIRKLYSDKMISAETALEYSDNPSQMQRLL